jgi:hypothetical protein
MSKTKLKVLLLKRFTLPSVAVVVLVVVVIVSLYRVGLLSLCYVGRTICRHDICQVGRVRQRNSILWELIRSTTMVLSMYMDLGTLPVNFATFGVFMAPVIRDHCCKALHFETFFVYDITSQTEQ